MHLNHPTAYTVPCSVCGAAAGHPCYRMFNGVRSPRRTLCTLPHRSRKKKGIQLQAQRRATFLAWLLKQPIVTVEQCRVHPCAPVDRAGRISTPRIIEALQHTHEVYPCPGCKTLEHQLYKQKGLLL